MSARADEIAVGAAGPSLAVVICTAGRPESLRRTLETVWGQSLDADELIVVDDGRLDDATLKWAELRCSGLGVAWIYFRKDRAGLTASRNIAAGLASSDILFFIDDDVSCGPGMFREIVSLMRDPAIGAISPLIVEPSLTSPGSQIFGLGYSLAGWWRISPRRLPRGERPAVLRDVGRARPLRWLSGAAMAIRRELVLAYPFDEALGGYALGEDREMGYRLAPRTWLVEALRVRAIHRRDAAGRADSRRFGFMTARNYLHILSQTCPLGLGEYVLLVWTFFVMAALQLAFSIVGDRWAHLAELRGMAAGLAAGIPEVIRRGRWRADADRVGTAVERRGRRVRVLFVTNRLEHGGAEWMLIEVAKRLGRFGVDPGVLCLKDAGPLAAECAASGVPVYEGLLHHKYDVEAIERIEQLIRRGDTTPSSRCAGPASAGGYDAIVAVGSGGDRMFWSTLAGRRAGVPVVVWSHWCPTESEQRFERANRAIYRMVDRFIALGRRHRDALIRWERVPAGRIEIIRNGIDAGRFDLRGQRAEARRRLGLADGDVGVGIVANLRREKRHDVFFAAARRVAERQPSARFFIIGDGPDRAAVEACARQSGLSGLVLQLMGARDDVPLLLNGLDVCCLSSDLECFSLTMLEAAAAGCAFVGPDSGSMNEFLENGTTGIATRPGDAGSLAAGIERLIVDPALRARLADAAAERVRLEFGVDEAAGGLAGLLIRRVGLATDSSDIRRGLV